jgi:hypothetical protein
LLTLQQLLQVRAPCRIDIGYCHGYFFIFPLFRNSSLDSRGDILQKIRFLGGIVEAVALTPLVLASIAPASPPVVLTPLFGVCHSIKAARD